MSTRQGRVIFLEDVLNRAVEQTRKIIMEKNVNTENVDETAREVGIGAVIFNELSNYRIKDYVFSWDKILNFEGGNGSLCPVYPCQSMQHIEECRRGSDGQREGRV